MAQTSDMLGSMARGETGVVMPRGAMPAPLMTGEEEERNEPTMRAGAQKAYDASLPTPPSGWEKMTASAPTQVHHQGAVHNARKGM